MQKVKRRTMIVSKANGGDLEWEWILCHQTTHTAGETTQSVSRRQSAVIWSSVAWLLQAVTEALAADCLATICTPVPPATIPATTPSICPEPQKTCHSIFVYNFEKCWLILKVLSLSDSAVNFLSYFQLHLKCVTTLPCEIQLFTNSNYLTYLTQQHRFDSKH